MSPFKNCFKFSMFSELVLFSFQIEHFFSTFLSSVDQLSEIVKSLAKQHTCVCGREERAWQTLEMDSVASARIVLITFTHHVNTTKGDSLFPSSGVLVKERDWADETIKLCSDCAPFQSVFSSISAWRTHSSFCDESNFFIVSRQMFYHIYLGEQRLNTRWWR